MLDDLSTAGFSFPLSILLVLIPNQSISLKYIIHLKHTPMITTIIILSWLLIGSITFGIACITDNTIQSVQKMIIITISGLLGFVVYIIHIIQENHDDLSKHLKKLNKTLKCLIIFASAIVFSSCDSFVEHEEREIGYSAVAIEYYLDEYVVLNDTVAVRKADNIFFSKRRAIPTGEWRYYRVY